MKCPTLDHLFKIDYILARKDSMLLKMMGIIGVQYFSMYKIINSKCNYEMGEMVSLLKILNCYSAQLKLICECTLKAIEPVIIKWNFDNFNWSWNHSFKAMSINSRGIYYIHFLELFHFLKNVFKTFIINGRSNYFNFI